MPLTLACRRCDVTLSADTEDELADLGREHAREHGHAQPMSHAKILARIGRHNLTARGGRNALATDDERAVPENQ